MGMKEFTSIEETGLHADHYATVQKWLDRGDGCAVYENAELGHPALGSRKFVSFGSEQAQIEADTPPQTLPDIGGSINWRYQLVGILRATG